jgi:flavodoxin
MEKSIVLYYSRTGNTEKLAKEIAKEIKADVEEIKDLKSRQGMLGWIVGGKDAAKRNKTSIQYKSNLSKYKNIFVGTPVWASTMTPAIRTFLSNPNIKEISLFCTYGGSEGNIFSDAEKLVKVNKKIGFLTKEIKDGSFKNKLEQLLK